MVKGKTASGFEFEINPAKFRDARFLRDYAKMKDDDNMKQLVLMEWLVGADTYDELCKHCENEDGIAPIDTVFAEMNEIIRFVSKASAEAKN